MKFKYQFQTNAMLLVVVLLVVTACKVTIEKPDGDTYTAGEEIHFKAEYDGTGEIKWKSEYTSPEAITQTIGDSEFKQGVRETGKGYPWEFYKSDLPIGVHKITAYKNDTDMAEVTITIRSFCDVPGTDCSSFGDGLCVEGVCSYEANACISRSLPDGTSCDDGDPATYGELCISGECAAEYGILSTDFQDFGVDYISSEARKPFIMDQAISKLSLYSGEIIEDEKELQLKGRGIDFSIKRYYRSGVIHKESAVFGNWDAEFNEYLISSDLGNEMSYYKGTGLIYELKKVQNQPRTWISTNDGFSGIFQEKSGAVYNVPSGCTVASVRQSGFGQIVNGIWLREADGTRKFFIPTETYYGEQHNGNIYRLAKTIDIDGNAISYYYQNVTDSDRKRVWCIVDTMLRPISVEYENEYSRNISKIEYFDGRTAKYLYNDNGQLATVQLQEPTDNTGQQFFNYLVYTYHVNEANNPLASIQTSDDIEAGREASQTFEYDENYRLSTWNVRDSYEQVGTYTLTYEKAYVSDLQDRDALHNQTTQIDPSGVTTTFRFNKDGLMRERQIFDDLHVGANDSAFSVTESVEFRYFWDNEGNLVEGIKPEGNSVVYEYTNAAGVYSEQDRIDEYWIQNWQKRYHIHNITQKTEKAGPRGDGFGGYATDKVTRYYYEPIANKLYKKVDPMGQVRKTIFDYQESSEGDVRNHFEDPIIMNQTPSVSLVFPESMEFGLGDINHNDELDPMRAHAIKIQMGIIEQDDGSSQDVSKEMEYDFHGRVIKMYDEIGVLTEYSYGKLPISDNASTLGQGYLAEVLIDANYLERALPFEALHERTSYEVNDSGIVVKEVKPDDSVKRYYFNSWTLNNNLCVYEFTPLTGGKGFYSYENYEYSRMGRLVRSSKYVGGINSHEVGDYLVASYSYDSMGRKTRQCKSVTESIKACNNYEYDALGRKIQTETPEGVVTNYIYNSFGKLYKTERGSGNSLIRVMRYYDSNGNMTSRREDVDNNNDGMPDGPVFVFDGFDRLVQKQFEDGTAYRRRYNKLDKMTLERYVSDDNSSLSRVRYEYDSFSRRTKVLADVYDLEGGTGLIDTLEWKYGYDATSRILREVSPSGDYTRCDYDGAGRIAACFDSEGNRIEYFRNEIGRAEAIEITNITDPEVTEAETRSYRWEYSYNALGKITERRRVDTADNDNFLLEEYEYDNLGRLETYTNADRHTTFYYRDLLGHLLRVKKPVLADENNPDGYVMMCTDYDLDGNVVAKYPDGNIGCAPDPNIEYTYTETGQLYEAIYPDGSFTRRSYNKGNQLAQFIDRNGSIISNSYDARERLTGRSVTRGVNVVGTTEESFVYDGLGFLTRAITNNDPETNDDDVVVNMEYDSLGRLLHDNVNGDVTAYEYSGEFMNRVTYPSGRVLDLGRDQKGRIKSLQFAAEMNPVARFDWLDGSYWAGQFGNGTEDAVDYDEFGRLNRLSAWDGEGSSLLDFSILRNGMNRPTERIDYLLSTSEQSVGDQFNLDELNRIRGVKHNIALDTPAALPEWGEEYGYDGRNNIVEQNINGVEYEFSVNTLDQYISRINRNTGEQISYSYDDAGNLIGKQGASENELFSFNFRNQINYYSKTSENLDVKYIYDALGRKRSRIAASNMGNVDESISETIYRYLKWEIVEEETNRDGSFSEGRIFIPGTSIDSVLRMDVLDGSMLDQEYESYYYHYDQSGNVHSLTDQSGEIVETYDYTAYGLATLNLTPGKTSPGNNIMFKGMRYDPYMSLYDSRLRWYDPSIGRFTSVDPIGIWGDTSNHGNGYGFLGLNTYYGSDPFGLMGSIYSDVWSPEDCRENRNIHGRMGAGENAGGTGGAAVPDVLMIFMYNNCGHRDDASTGDENIGDGGYTGITEDGAGYTGDASGDYDEDNDDNDDNDDDDDDDDESNDPDDENEECEDGNCPDEESEEADEQETDGGEGYPADPTEENVSNFDLAKLMRALFGESDEEGSWQDGEISDSDGIRVDFHGVINPPKSSDDEDSGFYFEADDTGHVWIIWNTMNEDVGPFDDLTTAEKIILSGFNGGELGPRPELISN